jgi:hypothetical protein
MRKGVVILCAICCFSVLALSGCYTSANYPEIREITSQCVDKYEEELLGLYDLCKNNNISDIGRSSANDIKDKGIDININNNQYFVVTPDGNKADAAKSEYRKACIYIDNIMKDYNIDYIHYYSHLNIMEIWFNEGLIDTHWGIVYYPPGVTPPEDIKGKDKSEEIKDGFYTYILWGG